VSDSTILFKKVKFKVKFLSKRTTARGWTCVRLKRGNNIIKSVKLSKSNYCKKEQLEGIGNKANKMINIKNVKLLTKTKSK